MRTLLKRISFSASGTPDILHVHRRLYGVNLFPCRPGILAEPVGDAGNAPLALAAKFEAACPGFFKMLSDRTQDPVDLPGRIIIDGRSHGADRIERAPIHRGSPPRLHLPPFHEHHQIILKTIPVFAIPDSVFCQIIVFQGAAHKIVRSVSNDKKELRRETCGGNAGSVSVI